MADLPSPSAPSPSSPSSLRVAGCWSGQIHAPLDLWSVSDLLSCLSSSSGLPLHSFNAICAGKILKNDADADGGAASRTLRQVGLKPNSKILITRIATSQHTSALRVEEQRHARLTRIKAAADAMVKRSGDNSRQDDDFEILLENQCGDKLQFKSEDDRKALMLGLMLHAKARDFIVHESYAEALEVLIMAEEAFDICDSSVLEHVDNVAFLQLDIVWCYFELKDMEKLTDAGKRLSEARKRLIQAHGPNLQRMRLLHGSFCPELAVYLKLELLEGIVAFHCGRSEDAEKSMRSALTKYNNLHVSDESLAFLTELGFTVKEATRALRISSQIVDRAIDFATEERKKELKRREEDKQYARQRRLLYRYGRTATGKVVELLKLNELVAIGYEKQLAAEALRQTDNNFENALDILTDPARNTAMQSSMKRKSLKVDNESLQQLLAMGFEEHRAIAALQQTSSLSKALTHLLQGSLSTSPTVVELGQTSSSSREGRDTTSNESDRAIEGESDADSSEDEDNGEDAGNEEEKDGRDKEMEDFIAADISGDHLEAYDNDVEVVGRVLFEYLDKLKSKTNG